MLDKTAKVVEGTALYKVGDMIPSKKSIASA